jgi:uncharacterized protein (DUF2267 family)/predicted transcriptional regulator
MYRRPRLVALNPGDPVLDAARAIEANNIGAVIIVDKGSVVGILTDRDLAIRVLARGLDPNSTRIREVMSSRVDVLPLEASQSDAISLMRQRNVRRVPLVEGDRLAGIVTLDDLLLDEAAPVDQLSAIIEAQIGEGGPVPSVRTPAMQRRMARTEATYRRLLNEVQSQAALGSADEADAALDVVLTALVRRLTPGEAKDLISQLPSLLHADLYALPPGPDKNVARETIEVSLAERLGIDLGRAEKILVAIGQTIAQNISDGQMEDVRGQLPETLRQVFSAPAQS